MSKFDRVLLRCIRSHWKRDIICFGVLLFFFNTLFLRCLISPFIFFILSYVSEFLSEFYANTLDFLQIIWSIQILNCKNNIVVSLPRILKNFKFLSNFKIFEKNFFQLFWFSIIIYHVCFWGNSDTELKKTVCSFFCFVLKKWTNGCVFQSEHHKMTEALRCHISVKFMVIQVFLRQWT